MRIDANFDGGSIFVVKADDPGDIQLRLRPDHRSTHAQWFYFCLHTVPGMPHRVTIVGARDAAYPEGWQDYRVAVSYDRREWFQVPTTFDGESLIIQHAPEYAGIFYAYTTPYTYERHLDVVHRAQLSPRCAVTCLGESLEGRPIHLLTIGRPGADKRLCWIIGRQHPGETMAEWFCEGLLERLLDEEDPLARTVLEKAVVYLVPNMNPDGTVRGHERMNAAGIDLNRQWLEPSLEKSPEAYRVRERMHASGVDFFLDAHGDENIPYVFLAGRPFSDRIERLRERFKAAFLTATPEYQTRHGYVADPKTPLNRTVAINYVGTTFDCVSFTLEMPFKDNAILPDPRSGWSAERSKRLGAAILSPLLSIVGDLR